VRTAAATVAASNARRRAAAERDAVELGKRVDLLKDETVVSLTRWLVVNCRLRGLEIPGVLTEED
jgi:hypothetical protein